MFGRVRSQTVVEAVAPPAVAPRAAGTVVPGYRIALRRRLAGSSLPRPSLFAVGALATVVLALLEFMNLGGRWLLFEDVQLVLAPLVAAVVVHRAASKGEMEHVGLRRALCASMVLTTIGQFARVVPDVVGGTATIAGGISDVAYIIGALIGMQALMKTLFEKLAPAERRVLLLDGMTIMVTSMTLVVAVWQVAGDLISTGHATVTGDRIAGLGILVVAASFFASAVSAVLVALALRVPPRLAGVWAVIAGIVLVAIAWCGWLVRFVAGAPDGIESMDFIFPLGALLLGYGGRTWTLQPRPGQLYDRLAGAALEWLPLVAVVGVGALAIGVHPGPNWLDPVTILAWIVVATAMVRQRLTRLREKAASARLARELQERAATSVSLARIEAADTPEATAERICLEALRLDGVDTAAVYVFETESVVPLAIHGLPQFPIRVAEPLPAEHGQRLRNHAEFGLWIERWASEGPNDALAREIVAAGLAFEAFVPLFWNEEPFGIIAMGTKSASGGERLTERLAALTEFSLVAAAILGPMAVERRRANDLRREIQSIIDAQAFDPVFQPFVNLESGKIVGYEALTRFHDGRRPDWRFGDAHAAGMSVELETATLRRQIAASDRLPEGCWVSLNASPELAERPELLLELLASTDRGIVLEITEHVEIADYPTLLAALARVRDRARLAVDDAGAGYAGLRHILELQPHFVKLDISVVRSVDTDPSRQAMVAGMSFFASAAGCELIAEGIESEGELETLRSFGVRIGQGFLLGRPARVD